MNRRSSRNRRTGTVAVELALTLPLLFMILFGCYEVSRANLMRHAALAAAYEGARVGIVPGADAASIRKSVTFVLASVGVREARIEVNPPTIRPDTKTINVRIEIPVKNNAMIMPFFTRDLNLEGECEMTRELF